jgi:nucleotidyltransferase substrate binding protein (TIGR01987 family)
MPPQAHISGEPALDGLHLGALEAALEQLRAGLIEAETTPTSTLLRDGVIQRYEYTVDLAWKLMQRYLRLVAQIPETEFRTKRDLFREAARLGLIADATAWFRYYDARNMTSHTYDRSIAEDIYRLAAPFAQAAGELVEALRAAH